MLRRTAASVVAASSVLLGTGAVAAPLTEQAAHAVADSAAETYRHNRADILERYHAATAQAQLRLEASADLDTAWQEYKRATATARATAHADLKQARREFQQTVAVARGT